MENSTAKKMALELMSKHGLLANGWTFNFDNARSRLGCCKHRQRIISLSTRWVEVLDETKVRDTILHEIAHALVGGGHGHDYVWQRKALEIGCVGNRCYNATGKKTPESKYIAICHGCGTKHKRNRKQKAGISSSCGICSPRIYNENYRLTWTLNPNG